MQLTFPFLLISFFVTSIIASYLMISEDWKDHLVFTQQVTTNTEHIYEIDKFLYAFKIEPIAVTIFILSTLYLKVGKFPFPVMHARIQILIA
ncbi:DUF4306 domain-containing protein [Bacillus gaemokensis]|uniref:DUF4306 domain-containing protein n=1 Tax=Bacillus gaemokensis TaxID=574375 RepID=UPI000691D590|nr:hypothetical protein AZF08_23070 [Bacillus gaemokensis]